MKKLLVAFAVLLSLASPKVFSQTMWDNFETTRKDYYSNILGTMVQPVANPAPSGINPSAHCMKYTRNGVQQYDNFRCAVHGTILDITDYVDGVKIMKMKFFSATAGTKVTLSLEDSNAAIASNYPIGRNSQYTATTTVTNAWEILQFSLASRIDPNTDNLSVNDVLIMIQPNTYTADTYYIDDLQFPEFNNVIAPPPPILHCIQDFECLNKLNFLDGPPHFSVVANPAPDAGNRSPYVGKIVKAPGQGDLYFGATADSKGGPLDSLDVHNVFTGKRKLRMRLYSNTAVKFTVTFEDTAALNPYVNDGNGGWPHGRHSIYQDSIMWTERGRWIDKVLPLHETHTEGCSEGNITRIIFQLNSQSQTGATVYIDSIYFPAVKKNTGNITTTTEYTWDDFDAKRNLNFVSADGIGAVAGTGLAIPAPAGATGNCFAYSRSSNPDDKIVLRPGAPSQARGLYNFSKYKRGTRAFSMDIFAQFPATNVTLTCYKSSAMNPLNKTAGVVATFSKATCQVPGGWEHLVFDGGNTYFDPAVSDSTVDLVTMQFDQGITYNEDVFFDNFYGPYYRRVMLGNDIFQSPDQSVVAYPNPASTSLTVGTANGVHIHSFEMFDVRGAMVKSFIPIPGSVESVVDISALAPGVYSLRAIQEHSVWQTPVFITR